MFIEFYLEFSLIMDLWYLGFKTSFLIILSILHIPLLLISILDFMYYYVLNESALGVNLSFDSVSIFI